ncbi:MAG TPA: ABC transporter permease subunit [Gemmataceae bacterium]|nr:ABC transporter permease subunit [Gemmataceae bacterium]
MVHLLHYRPWRGTFRGPLASVWPVCRIALLMIFRRKLFWGLYALGLLVFLMFFFGQYFLAFAETQLSESSIPLFGRRDPHDVVTLLRRRLKLNGSGDTYANFFWYQGYMVMVILSLAGSVLIGNDIQHGSLPFYLSKPLSRWHYLLGKCLAVGTFVNLMTTLPAFVLFIQWGLLDGWDYFWHDGWLLAGILGYGLLLTVSLSLVVIATASWLRRTVPMIMAWATLFVFLRFLGGALVDGLHYDRHWRLIDLWNDLYLVGGAMLGAGVNSTSNPDWYAAAVVVAVVCGACLAYLVQRIRGVEIVK